MLKKEAAGLCNLVAFFTAYTMFFNNVVDVIDDVLPADGTYGLIVIMRKKKPHLLRVIADSAW